MKSSFIIFITQILLITIHSNCYAQEYGNIRSNPSSNTQYFYNTLNTDTLAIRPGWNWLSFPRLDRTSGNPTVNEVIGGHNLDPSDYRPGSNLANLPPSQENEYENIYDGINWPETFPLNEIDSRYGYKLQLLYDPEDPPEKEWLHLSGDVINAGTPLSVYSRYDNWTGYWLYENQSPFSAFPPSVLDKLKIITAQNWICVKYSPSPDQFGTQPPSYWGCACHEGKVEMKYGDMVILKSEEDAGNFNFQWLRYGNAVGGQDRPPTEYFLYQEQPDYVPYLVEIDSKLVPDEIGAFVNDTCVGATSVLAGDTMVLVPGYIEGISGEVTFELYYDSLKSSPKVIPEYWVENPDTRYRNRRTLHTSERQDYFLVSFMESDQENNHGDEAEIHVVPNPSKENWTIMCSIPEAGDLYIEVFDLFGKKLDVLSEGYIPAGIHTFEVKPEDLFGIEMSNGIYLLRLRCGGYTAITKLILLK